MKRHMERIPQYVAIALAALLAGDILCGVFGYTLAIRGIEFVLLLLAILFVVGAIWLRAHAHYRHFKLDKRNFIAAVSILPLALASVVVYEPIFAETGTLLVLSAAMLMVAAACLLLRTGNVAIGIVCLAIVVLLAPMLSVLFTFHSVSFWSKFTSEPVPSPDGKYVAQAVIVDSGALGSDERIEVARGTKIDLGLFTLTPKPFQSIGFAYNGYGVFPPIAWQDNETLLVGSTAHRIQ